MINEPIITQFAQENLRNVVDKGSQLFSTCPFCGKEFNHFNISKETGKFNCYSCGKGGSFESLTKKLLGWKVNVKDVIEEYSSGITLATLIDIYDKDTTVGSLYFDWKEDTISIFDSKVVCKRALEYLMTRNMTRKLIERLEFRVGIAGKYENMIVMPVYFNEEVVNLVARRIPPYRGRRYDGPHKDEAILNKSELLYNYDNVLDSDWVVVCEGVFDCIALAQKGVPCVALLGKEISTDQILLLVEKWDKIVILLDGGFEDSAIKNAKKLEGLTKTVQIAMIDGEEDPSENPLKAKEAIENAKSIECY